MPPSRPHELVLESSMATRLPRRVGELALGEAALLAKDTVVGTVQANTTARSPTPTASADRAFIVARTYPDLSTIKLLHLCDEVGQVLQRVVEVVRRERRELEVLAHLGRDR